MSTSKALQVEHRSRGGARAERGRGMLHLRGAADDGWARQRGPGRRSCSCIKWIYKACQACRFLEISRRGGEERCDCGESCKSRSPSGFTGWKEAALILVGLLRLMNLRRLTVLLVIVFLVLSALGGWYWYLLRSEGMVDLGDLIRGEPAEDRLVLRP